MTEIDYDSLTEEDIIPLYSTPAHTLEVGDQIIVDGEHCEILSMPDSFDPDVVTVKVYNHDGGMDEFNLHADDEFTIWSV